MSKVSEVSQVDPQVQKEAEYAVFLGFIAEGLWKNNRFIADVVGVDEDTIASWKKRQEVVKLRQQSINDDLKKWKRTADAEKRLVEQGMDFDPPKSELKITGLNEVGWLKEALEN